MIPRIVVVGAAAAPMGTLCAALRTAGFDVRIAERPASLEATLLQHAADVVVMDADAPEGFAAAAQLRTRHSVGLVMLRTGIDREDRLLALSAGADHLLAKPADPRELVAVVRNLHLRLRSAAPAAAAGSARAWRFDPVQWILGTPDGRSVQLSMAEQLVIGRLLDVPGRVAARAELVELLARHGIRVYSRNLDALISRVRRKVFRTGSRDRMPILSARNVGYVFTGTREIVDRRIPLARMAGGAHAA